MYLGLLHGHPCSFVDSNSSTEPPGEAFSLGRNNLAILDADVAKFNCSFRLPKFKQPNNYVIASYTTYM